jgi:hypothetical protein
MRGFAGGAISGFLLGAVVVYLVLEKPWQSDGVEEVAVADAGPVAGKNKRAARKGKRRRRAASADVGPVVLTPAERKLVWRGPPVEVAEREVDFSAGGGGRPLQGAEIDEGVKPRAAGVIECITEARGDAEVYAEITVKFLVEGDGRVSKARVRAPAYLQGRGLLACVRGELAQARFAATGAQTAVTVPFTLN